MFSFLPTFIPNLMQAAPFVIGFALLFAKPLRKHPGLFYAIWTPMVVAVTWTDPVVSVLQESTPVFVLAFDHGLDAFRETSPIIDGVFQFFTSSFTGVCLYLVVMFIGALKKTPIVKKLLSIRSELSVLGGIIIMGHVIRIIDFPFLFLNPAWSDIWGYPAADFMFIATVVVGPLLTLTFLIPWITSFRVVRNAMSHTTWKKTQKLAYPFMALMIAQGFFLALGHCLYGYPYTEMDTLMAIMSNPTQWLGTFAQQVATAWMYLTLGVAYLVLRIRKYQEDRARKHAAKAHAEARIPDTQTSGDSSVIAEAVERSEAHALPKNCTTLK